MKYLLTLAMLAAAIPGKSQYLLEGKASNYKAQYIYIQYTDANGVAVIDSSAVKNGTFRFSGDLKEPVMAVLKNTNNARAFNDSVATMLFIEPKKMTITLEDGKLGDAKLTGSVSHAQYSEMERQTKLLGKRWQTVFDTLAAVNKRSNFQFQELKNWVLTPYHVEREEIVNSFLRKYPDSYVTAFQLRFLAYEMNTDTLNKWYAGFSPAVKKSSYGKAVYEEIRKKKIGIPGAVAAAFSGTDLDGKQLQLSDYKGKYVLLDFWASWCLPCRKSNPHLKELYAKYKDKGFEIVGISDDDSNPDAWKKAVAKDEIAMWRHVLRGMKRTPTGLDRTNDKLDAYNVHSLPTKILVGPDGVIIGRWVEGDREESGMNEKLAAIFGS